MATQIVEHVEETLARLTIALKDKPRIAAFLMVFAEQTQAIENALWELLTERGIETAIGEQLDVIGRIVGQVRAGESDDIYRQLVRARISANFSKGLTEDLLRVASQILADEEDVYFEIESQRIADVVLRVLGVVMSAATAGNVVDLLGESVAAGVRILIEYPTDTDAETFRFDSADPGKGWGDQGDAGVGGKLATVQVG
jgi:hypothetical protein